MASRCISIPVLEFQVCASLIRMGSCCVVKHEIGDVLGSDRV